MDRIRISGKLCLAALDFDSQAVDTLAVGCPAMFALVYSGCSGCAASYLVGKSALVVGIFTDSHRWTFPGAAPQSRIRFSDIDFTGLSSGDGLARSDRRTLPVAGIFCSGRITVYRVAGIGGIPALITLFIIPFETRGLDLDSGS